MRIFHFIKYNDQTSVDHLLTLAHDNTVICFDFEDSIQDVSVPANSAKFKAHYRNCFKTIIRQFHPDQSAQIGVRINPFDSAECAADIDLLTEVGFISTIFLPKTIHVNQILDLQRMLKDKGVTYGEIIPVIETKAGMNNLAEIVKDKDCKIKSVAFGHCDYNLDNGLFPFFHQQSREYWSWIIKMNSIVKPYHVSIINSPFLQLQNGTFFRDVLHVLRAIGGHDVGQIVLNAAQSKICHSFSAQSIHSVSYKISHTLNLQVPSSFANDFIHDFEQHSYGKGFAINEEGVLLSPHEYHAALQHQRNLHLPQLNFTFVGGCFPVQGDILFEDLFHQKIRRQMEAGKKNKFNVNIIRYERFSNCLQKISKLHLQKPINILAFSIRPEPFLRLVKLYYQYYDQFHQRRKWSFNLPFLNQLNPEKYDLLELNTGFPSNGMPKGTIIQRGLRNLNYVLGSILGNENRAWRQYEKLIHDVIDYCQQENISLILLGPPVRTNWDLENLLSKRLAVHSKNMINKRAIHYVSGTGSKENGVTWFDQHGIYASEQYHALISDRMVKIIREVMAKQNIAVVNDWSEASSRQVEEQFH